MNRFLLESGLLLVGQLLDVAHDCAGFFHCIIAVINAIDTGFPKNSYDLRKYLCENLWRSAEFTIPGLGLTPLEYFDKEYAENARQRQYLHNSHYDAIFVERGGDPLFVDTFENYLFFMELSNTHVDELMLAFAAFYLQLDLKILTRAVSELQLETSEILEVMQLISMGFSKSVAQQVLSETNMNLGDAIEILLQMDSTKTAHAPSEAKKEVWREQQYPCNFGIKIFMILDGGHFQLVNPVEESVGFSSGVHCNLMSIGFSRQTAEPIVQQRLQVLDIPDSLFDNRTSVHHSMLSPFEITEPTQFYKACLGVLTANSFPFYMKVQMEFTSLYANSFHDHLFGSLVFVEHNCVRYRVVSFTMQNGLEVRYHGAIVNLSKSSEKKIFFNQLYQQIQHQNVISVNIAQLI